MSFALWHVYLLNIYSVRDRACCHALEGDHLRALFASTRGSFTYGFCCTASCQSLFYSRYSIFGSAEVHDLPKAIWGSAGGVITVSVDACAAIRRTLEREKITTSRYYGSVCVRRQTTRD